MEKSIKKKIIEALAFNIFTTGIVVTITSPVAAVAFHPLCAAGVIIGLALVVAGYRLARLVAPK